jgi:subtilisin family serine protease
MPRCYAISSISPLLAVGFWVAFSTFTSAQTALEKQLLSENAALHANVAQLRVELAAKNTCSAASPITDPLAPTLLRKLSVVSNALTVARYNSGQRDVILPDSLLQAEVPAQYILVLNDDDATLDDAASIAAAYGLPVSAIRYVYSRVLTGFAANMSEADRTRLEADPRVSRVVRDGYIFATQSGASSSDPVDQTVVPTATAPLVDPVDVYVFDSGIRAAHIALQGRVGSGFTSFRNGIGTEDCNGHGTHIAATIGGRVYGQTDQARLVSVKVLDNANYGDVSTLIAGVEWVLEQPSQHRLVNMSLTRKELAPPAESLLDLAVMALIDDGVPVIVAAGNSRSNARHYSPARVPGAITVGALDGEKIAATSNSGTVIDLYTQGENILSAAIGDTCGQVTMSGTSMAAARVAGRASRLMADGVAPNDIDAALKASAQRVETGNFTGETARLVLDTGGAGEQVNPLCPRIAAPLAPPTK